MKISEIASVVDGSILCSAQAADTDIASACAFDMMSAGLVNPQVVCTAVMVDISCIVFVCGKRPDADMVKLAENYNIVFISTEMSTYEAAGRLYAAGLSA